MYLSTEHFIYKNIIVVCAIKSLFFNDALPNKT